MHMVVTMHVEGKLLERRESNYIKRVSNEVDITPKLSLQK
jgi:hypothetical protein